MNVTIIVVDNARDEVRDVIEIHWTKAMARAMELRTQWGAGYAVRILLPGVDPQA